MAVTPMRFGCCGGVSDAPLIRDAGFIPKQRDTLYRTYFLN